ncbi:hypothetical protein AAFF_G00048440 [Aldrovandia affinis]|uniref:Uncharacterized protein n=1 Tax=Aldrovandia affinis TaxID=143900 RepID=A0AAD7S1J0_9TELE|nr:hypothetical protein AAFF_G00048440 [Aldrovandia affinis]
MTGSCGLILVAFTRRHHLVLKRDNARPHVTRISFSPSHLGPTNPQTDLVARNGPITRQHGCSITGLGFQGNSPPLLQGAAAAASSSPSLPSSLDRPPCSVTATRSLPPSLPPSLLRCAQRHGQDGRRME